MRYGVAVKASPLRPKPDKKTPPTSDGGVFYMSDHHLMIIDTYQGYLSGRFFHICPDKAHGEVRHNREQDQEEHGGNTNTLAVFQ